MKNSFVLWFTGLSGSGKTTIADKLYDELVNDGKSAIILDGDKIRSTIHKNLGFTPDDIKKNNELIAKLCLKYNGKYDYILVPIISPFTASRKKAKELIGKNFIEVYVQASLETVIKRDVKGLYNKALRGEIPNFIGISSGVPYEEPFNPDVVLNTEKEDIDTVVKKMVGLIRKKWVK
jgi:adenylylsulfate kinase